MGGIASVNPNIFLLHTVVLLPQKEWQFFCGNFSVWIFRRALIYDSGFVGRISHSCLGEYASTVSADRSKRNESASQTNYHDNVSDRSRWPFHLRLANAVLV